jgi:hypothetical protein
VRATVLEVVEVAFVLDGCEREASRRRHASGD